MFISFITKNILLFLFVGFLIFGALLLSNKPINVEQSDVKQNTESANQDESQSQGQSDKFCNRKEPYPNPPELAEAIELVEERLSESLSNSQVSEEIERKTGNWLNCVNAKYTNLPEGVEGAFVFDENSSVNNLQIFVDNDYKNYDVLLRAMILSHELRHVLQFLEFKATGQELSCVDSEVQAFLTQYLFFNSLHEDEKDSLVESTKKNLTDEEYAPIVNMHITSKLARQKCGGSIRGSCYRTELTNLIRSIILSNPYYQDQCNL